MLDVLRGSVRPVLAYLFGIALVAYAGFILVTTGSLIAVFSDVALLVIGFYFGQRTKAA